MKRIISSLLILLYFTIPSFSQFKLEIEISGLRNTKGNLMLQLLDSKEKILEQEMIPVTDSICSFTFADLDSGDYAVRYYHDENVNGKMDTNIFGKPTEGYGFSNNVIGKSGPPPFGKWLFVVDSDKKIVLKATY